ncbi:hypothetical protein IWQ62_006855 [Dispira parvispora]|uniref:Uncharacterized protein n=1 Tax=Dispira parvispora TaxID=1520584 RepID=A0A9W8AN79_9FUNG|nr:hypothetical protein IWQ62_006855 [Dispira parvispora]
MAIMLFHPVMLHTYQKYNVNIHTFWVSLTHLKWFSGSTTFGTSFSDTLGTHSHTDISNSAANDIKIGGGKGNILASLDHRIPMGTETEFSGILNCHFRESSSQAISSELKLDGLDGIKALEPDNLEHDGQVTSYHGFDDPVCL